MATGQSWFSRRFSQGKKKGTEDSAALKDWSAGQEILDDFVVERELGAGGLGKVYLLRSRSTGQPFAVKRALVRDADTRRNLLAELRTWIDLPEHPHLVACRFFRTVGDEVVIFAEFVERGSLETLIQERQLTSLEQILDAAIQFAWGLHAAHEHGLVHQDVKPGNALMTAAGLVKVADFGLARARVRAEGSGAVPACQNILVSWGGMTPAYCSPEQAQGQPLSRQTDVWSWGVAILEMFSGEVTWRTGQTAAAVLKAYLKRPVGPGLPAMPNVVAEVLLKCFRHEPAERWTSLAEAADALQSLHRQATGHDYPRSAPLLTIRKSPALGQHDRRRVTGSQWEDPREWLIKALRAAGRDAEVARLPAPAPAATRKAHAVANLQTYEEARDILERLVAEGRKDLENQLAILCINKAFVHEHTDDVPGAVALYDRAVALYERLVESEGRRELANDLACAYMSKATAVGALGDKHTAVALFDQAVAVYERLVGQEGQPELANHLATAYLAKATSVGALGDNRAAVALYDRAVAVYERLVEGEGRRELANNLATAYLGKATVVGVLGDNRAAVALYDRAIALYERVVEGEGRRELANNLATAYMSKANAVSVLGDKHAAVALYDRAVALYERLVEREGRRELADKLAWAYMSKANAVSVLGDKHAAVALYDRAVALYERLVGQEGRRELADMLAIAYQNKAIAVGALGDDRAAVALYERAVGLYERLVEREGRRELANELASAYLGKATAVGTLGDIHAAVALFDQAAAVYERLVGQEGRRELANKLAIAYQNKAIAVGALGDNRAAVALYDRAVALYRRLVEQEGRKELQGDLARVVAYRAGALLGLGDLQKAQGDARKAVPVLKAEIARTGRADLQGPLDWATTALREVL